MPMNPFVDPNKRDGLLPSGKKDLIEILELRLPVPPLAAHFATAWGASSYLQKRVVMALEDISVVVDWFLQWTAHSRLFIFSAPDHLVDLILYRDGLGTFRSQIFYPDAPLVGYRMRKVFTTLGLRKPTGAGSASPEHSAKTPGQQVREVLPVPRDLDGLVFLVREVFEQGCEMRSRDVITCVMLEPGFAALE